MSFQQCERGHYFDPAQDPRCPFCANEPVPEAPPPVSPFGRPVGWLVAIDGPARGQDVSLRAGPNPVTLGADPSRAAGKPPTIEYDPQIDIFLLHAGQGGQPALVNSKTIESVAALRAGDKLSVAGATLVFVPLTGEGFRWPA